MRNCKIFIVVFFSMLLLVQPVSAVKMYAPDGRTANVHSADVDAWKNVGWYDYPVFTVYARDGRTAVISITAVQEWARVGWYIQNPITMFAPDGRTVEVAVTDIDAWKNVGWYEMPVTTMYAFDGRSAVVAKSEVSAWQNVGWFQSKENIYQHVADLVIGKDWGYNAQANYHCVESGDYYYLISWQPYANGQKWDRVNKWNGNVEFLYEGSEDYYLADYIYANYNLPIYCY